MRVDAFGTPSVVQEIRPKTVPPGYRLASDGVSIIPFSRGFGSPDVVQEIHPTGFGSSGRVGSPSIIFPGQILPTSIAALGGFGTPRIQNSTGNLPGVLFQPFATPFVLPIDHPDLLGVLPMPGRTFGRTGVPPPGLSVSNITAAVAQARWASGGRDPPGGHVSLGRPAFDIDLTIGANWFDKIHVLPRSAIDFGRFVTPVSATYEVFNAYRRHVTLTFVTDTSSEGLALPGLPTLPYVMTPFSSLLDPSSVAYSPVRLTVTAELSGDEEF